MSTITALQVQCIIRENPTNPFSPIIRLGGLYWSYTVPEVINLMIAGVVFYTEVAGNRAYLEIVYDAYHRPTYVRTQPDAVPWNNLETLPRCS
jgi:hypothetical protein